VDNAIQAINNFLLYFFFAVLFYRPNSPAALPLRPLPPLRSYFLRFSPLFILLWLNALFALMYTHSYVRLLTKKFSM